MCFWTGRVCSGAPIAEPVPRRLVSVNLENASRIRAFGSVRIFGHDAIVKPTALGPVAKHRHTKLLIYGLFQKGRVLAQDVTRNAPLILPVARPGSPHETSSGLVPRSRLGGNLARLCIRRDSERIGPDGS